MATVWVSAGDVSGDAIAAGLIRAFAAARPETRFVGIGGPEMAAAGLERVANRKPSRSGAPRMAPGLGRIAGLWRRVIRGLRRPASLVVVVDSGGFHLPSCGSRGCSATRRSSTTSLRRSGSGGPGGSAGSPRERTDRRRLALRAGLLGRARRRDRLRRPPYPRPAGRAASARGRASRRAGGPRPRAGASARRALSWQPPQRALRHLPPMVAALALLREARPELDAVIVRAPSVDPGRVDRLLAEAGAGSTVRVVPAAPAARRPRRGAAGRDDLRAFAPGKSDGGHRAGPPALGRSRRPELRRDSGRAAQLDRRAGHRSGLLRRTRRRIVSRPLGTTLAGSRWAVDRRERRSKRFGEPERLGEPAPRFASPGSRRTCLGPIAHSLALLAAAGLSPALALAWLVRPRLRPYFGERLGHLPADLEASLDSAAQPIYVHAASVGEAKAAARLIDRLEAAGHCRRDDVDRPSATCCGSPTRRCPPVPARSPLDGQRLLQRVRPALSVLIETELGRLDRRLRSARRACRRRFGSTLGSLVPALPEGSSPDSTDPRARRAGGSAD